MSVVNRMIWLLMMLSSATQLWAVNSGCAELADARDSGLPGPPAGQPQVTCAGFFPFAVAADGSEETRLEVRISGTGVSAAALGNAFPIVGVKVDGVAVPQTGAFIDLFDDGSHGDLVASDGIWSRGTISVEATALPPLFFFNFDKFRYTNGSGTATIGINAANSPGQYGPAKLGRLDPALRVTPQDRGSGYLVTDNVVFMIDANPHAELRWLLRAAAPVADIKSVTNHFYQRFPDAFDFIILMPGAHVPGGLAGAYLSGSNNVSGIGRVLSDDTASWGSAGQLQSVLAVNLTDGGPIIHELSHRWGISVGASQGVQQCAGAHVGVAGVGCGPLGGFDASSLVDNGNGTWTVSNDCFSVGGAAADTTAMNPLNLYLAGLIPASQVPPFPVPVNVNCGSISQNFANKTVTFAADGMVTYTINDIISEHGARIPDHSISQRDFTLAWVVPMNRAPTATEAGWFQYRAEYIARMGVGGQAFRLTFNEATGGRATLSTGLQQLLERIFGDSFETP